MGLFRKLTSVITFGAVDFRSGEDRTQMCVRPTGEAPMEHNRLTLAARDQATRAHIADLQVRAAASAGYVARMGSSDPAVRAAAYTDWNAENLDEMAAARSGRRSRSGSSLGVRAPENRHG
jgi:hypothetical protein